MVTNSKKSMTIMPRYSGEGEETTPKAKTMTQDMRVETVGCCPTNGPSHSVTPSKTYQILQLLKNSLLKPIDTTPAKLRGTRSYAEGWNDCIKEVTKILEGVR